MTDTPSHRCEMNETIDARGVNGRSARRLAAWPKSALVGLALAAAPDQAAAGLPVDLELVLAVDLSISVDGSEFVLQRQGYVEAFRDPAVVAAVGANPRGVAVAVVLWAGSEQQRTAVDWHWLTDAASCLDFAAAIEAALQLDPDYFGKTAIGDALYFALRELDANSLQRIPPQGRPVGRRQSQRGLQARAGARLRRPVRGHGQRPRDPERRALPGASTTAPTSSAAPTRSSWWRPTTRTSSRRSGASCCASSRPSRRQVPAGPALRHASRRPNDGAPAAPRFPRRRRPSKGIGRDRRPKRQRRLVFVSFVTMSGFRIQIEPDAAINSGD